MTISLTWEQYLATEEPIHLAEIRWWYILGEKVKACRAVFWLEHTLWKDHPWGKEDPRDDRVGAPFHHDWAIEQQSEDGRWRSTGRWDDWRGPASGGYAGSNRMFSTEEEALKVLREQLNARYRSAVRRVEELRSLLSDLDPGADGSED